MGDEKNKRLPIKEMQHVGLGPAEKKDGDRTLRIVMKQKRKGATAHSYHGRTYLLVTDSVNEARTWLDAIHELLHPKIVPDLRYFTHLGGIVMKDERSGSSGNPNASSPRRVASSSASSTGSTSSRPISMLGKGVTAAIEAPVLPMPLEDMSDEDREIWETRIQRYESRVKASQLVAKNLSAKQKQGSKPKSPPVKGGALGKARKKARETRDKVKQPSSPTNTKNESVSDRVKRQAEAASKGQYMLGGATVGLGKEIASSKMNKDLAKKREEHEKEQARKKAEDERKKREAEEQRKKNQPKGLKDFIATTKSGEEAAAAAAATTASSSSSSSSANANGNANGNDPSHKLRSFLSSTSVDSGGAAATNPTSPTASTDKADNADEPEGDSTPLSSSQTQTQSQSQTSKQNALSSFIASSSEAKSETAKPEESDTSDEHERKELGSEKQVGSKEPEQEAAGEEGDKDFDKKEKNSTEVEVNEPGTSMVEEEVNEAGNDNEGEGEGEDKSKRNDEGKGESEAESTPVKENAEVVSNEGGQAGDAADVAP